MRPRPPRESESSPSGELSPRPVRPESKPEQLFENPARPSVQRDEEHEEQEEVRLSEPSRLLGAAKLDGPPAFARIATRALLLETTMTFTTAMTISCFSALLAAGCASGDGTGTPAPAKRTTADSADGGSGKGVSPDGGSGAPAKSASGAPSCATYYASGGCCESLASGVAAAVDACRQGKKAIDDGIAMGAASADYESACKQAIMTAQSLGRCN